MTAEYTILTPAGMVTASWGDDEDSRVVYTGSDDGLSFFREFMAVARVSGRGGIPLYWDSLEPFDLYAYCQSAEYGILVFPDPESMIAILDEQLMEGNESEQERLRQAIAEATEALKSASDPIEKVKKAAAVGRFLKELEQLGGEMLALKSFP